MATGAKIRPRALTMAVMTILRRRMAEAEFMWNYSDVARHVEISDAQTRKILKGEKPVTLEELDQLCDALRLRLSDVVREAELGITDLQRLAAEADNLDVSPTEKARSVTDRSRGVT